MKFALKTICYRNVKQAALFLILGVLGTLSCYGTLIFDNAVRGDFQTIRDPESSPVAAITVSGATTINAIGALVDLNSAGNLKFLIFDLDSSVLLFSTLSQAFADDGLAYKVSSDFAPFILQPGINYGIGAIADVGGAWETNNASSGNPFTQNGITASDDRNGNVSNFSSPNSLGDGSAMTMIQLYSPNGVPDAGTTSLLMGLSLVGLATARWKFKRA
jgi:hypothetical protein